MQRNDARLGTPIDAHIDAHIDAALDAGLDAGVEPYQPRTGYGCELDQERARVESGLSFTYSRSSACCTHTEPCLDRQRCTRRSSARRPLPRGKAGELTLCAVHNGTRPVAVHDLKRTPRDLTTHRASLGCLRVRDALGSDTLMVVVGSCDRSRSRKDLAWR